MSTAQSTNVRPPLLCDSLKFMTTNCSSDHIVMWQSDACQIMGCFNHKVVKNLGITKIRNLISKMWSISNRPFFKQHIDACSKITSTALTVTYKKRSWILLIFISVLLINIHSLCSHEACDISDHTPFGHGMRIIFHLKELWQWIFMIYIAHMLLVTHSDTPPAYPHRQQLMHTHIHTHMDLHTC